MSVLVWKGDFLGDCQYSYMGMVRGFERYGFFSKLFLIEVCSDYLGMENGDIPNENIEASHQYSSYPASKARLNGIKFWACAGSLASPWIQADIGYQTYVSGVITQGDGGIGD